ncbi:hypothetical protein FoTM2_002542 [Fusarium oxysporum f. sp. vasinfectum]|uniref:Spore coat protein SP96 n=1 Tax=Fusarium oxysporum f. sp. vasinfectum 25433 TaxID=1089449 RepID=X0MJU3_FUSOX|nr:hypothetical protein FOTG_02366 [Fusarium oxysporum f. sp. vasinfectum 25433]KAK2939324.1 hypothetical protein FoTM2_002542 [Fusarium oxysporum f. sp. vasinfectum]
MFAKAFTIATLASFASAHMLMANPKPYGNPNNSPLEADGSDFPCKGKVNDGSGDNVYKQGSTQELSFTGQAVHGGGSCQVSITTDKNPTKDSVWKVIKSIEGGCPSRTATGNLGGNPDAPNPDKYDFTIPKELAAGEYTLAWTWFNHVGNREMYMNCAAITVEGSGGSKDLLNSLPDMFVANIGNKCETLPDTDLAFPNPGKDVSKLKSKLDGPSGTGCQKAGSGSGDGGSDGGSGGGDSQPSTPVAAPTTNNGAQPTQPAATPAPSAGNGSGSGSGSGDGSNGTPEIPGGAFITVSQPSASQPTATQAPATPETPQDGSGSGEGSGSGDGNQSGGSGSGSSGFAAGTACTNEGEWNCIGGSTFQRCASGAWTATQQLSSGVSCTPGQGADIAMTTKRGKRNMRRAQRA